MSMPVKLQREVLLIIEKLPDEQAGKLIKAIGFYGLNGEWPHVDQMTEFVLSGMIESFEKQQQSYRSVLERNRNNGLKGGRPKPTGLFENPKEPSGLLKAIDTQQPKTERAKKQKPKPEDTTAHWKALVSVWFDFHPKVGLQLPSFKGADPADLKVIADQLCKRVVNVRKEEWTEDTAKNYLGKFLQYAWDSNDWLKRNFLLSHLNRNFDSIISNNGKSTSKPVAGQSVNDDHKRDLAQRLARATGQV